MYELKGYKIIKKLKFNLTRRAYFKGLYEGPEYRVSLF